MQLPFDLLSQSYVKPRLFLCETDKTRICQLDTIEMSGKFTFNAYAELTFTVGRTYINMTTGETEVNPFYDKIQGLRLVYLEGFGYFEIQEPEIVSDGIKEIKNVTAYSLEYTLSQKYLEELYVNTGELYDLGVNGDTVTVITLYNPNNIRASLLDYVLEKAYGWSIGHVDASLATMSRTFEISRTSVYDFIVQDICEKFNCFVEFDTVNNKIHFYAESLITKFIGNGKTTKFTISPPYKAIGSVSIGGYRTTQYSYNPATGELAFVNAPADGKLIEIIDDSQLQWVTDVYITFDNLAQEVNISYSADDIKTVLTVKGADDLSIHEVNMGLPYITDISYYCTPDWMGQELYTAYLEYVSTSNENQRIYQENSEQIWELKHRIDYEENRLSLEYSSVDSVIDKETGAPKAGTYYVRGGTSPNYYYTEVTLPTDYSAHIERYYKLSGISINKKKVNNLYNAFKKYFISKDKKDTSGIRALMDSFQFMQTNKIGSLATALENATTNKEKDTAILTFLNEMWEQIGRTPLESLYKASYQKIKDTNEEAGWHEKTSENYWNYYPVTLMLQSLEDEIEQRKKLIEPLKADLNKKDQDNKDIVDSLSLDVFFTKYYKNQGASDKEALAKAKKLLIRLNAFLREDEYTDDNFIATDIDTNETRMQTKRELLECGRIELQKLCEPKLSFSMDMANIYALPEFKPIVHQFKLGNLINVKLRDDYIKRARLLSVNFNFNDFTDFSCEFGEMTNLKTPSSIHADLLANAISAGKSVASKTSYLNKGADLATATDLKIQQGLLGAIDGLYTSDQSVTIDNNGILLRKVNDDGSFSPYQTWLTSNTILLSDDGFRTSRTGLGQFTANNKTFYGVLAEAMLSGYIEGSIIKGGTIDIGNGRFVVDKNGNVTMKSSKIDGYATTTSLESTSQAIRAEVEDIEKELSSQISVNAGQITSKVSKDDFGTLIEQNYDHVKIAWNNNSKYITFEDGALNIYTSATHSNDTLLMKQNYQGAWYYHNGYTVGKIGTNHITDNANVRGLCFNLESDGDYMSWSCKENASDSTYTMKMVYYAPNNNYNKNEGIYFSTRTYHSNPIYLQGSAIYANDNARLRSTVSINDRSNDLLELFYANSSGSYTAGGGTSLAAMQTNGSTVTRFTCYSDRFVFYESENNRIDCFNHIYMNNYDIYDTEISTSSDARLKTNIQDTKVNALDTINQIEMKEFDWIENEKHEEIGMIAQQLQAILPDLVVEDKETGKLSIKMNRFIPYLIKAVQELSTMVNKDVQTSEHNQAAQWSDIYDIATKTNFIDTIKYLKPKGANFNAVEQDETFFKPTKVSIS